MSLKCNMIFNYPQEYHDLYKRFKDGGTVREWINSVESLSSVVFDNNPHEDVETFKRTIPGEWQIDFDGMFHILKVGRVSDDDLDIMRRIGNWNGTRWDVNERDMARFLHADDLNKFKGDMLEVLSEMFFHAFGADEGVGVVEYNPVELSSDFGVDATGRNVNGHNCVIQVKYRGNPADLVTYSEIARTFTSAVLQFNMEDVAVHDHTVYLFTTSGGVTAAFEKVMERRCVIINRSIIATKIDNNKTFWEGAYREMFNTLDS